MNDLDAIKEAQDARAWEEHCGSDEFYDHLSHAIDKAKQALTKITEAERLLYSAAELMVGNVDEHKLTAIGMNLEETDGVLEKLIERMVKE